MKSHYLYIMYFACLPLALLSCEAEEKTTPKPTVLLPANYEYQKSLPEASPSPARLDHSKLLVSILFLEKFRPNHSADFFQRHVRIAICTALMPSDLLIYEEKEVRGYVIEVGQRRRSFFGQLPENRGLDGIVTRQMRGFIFDTGGSTDSIILKSEIPDIFRQKPHYVIPPKGACRNVKALPLK